MLYLEKAIACTVRGADSLREACRKNGTVFNAGVLRRFCSWAGVTKEAIDRGEIGEPKIVAHHGGGSLMHSHVHSIDTISYLLGDPEIVAVRGELQPREMKIVDNHVDADPRATFQIVFANGVEAYSLLAGPVETEVIGTENSIRASNTLDGSEATVHLRAASGGERRPVWKSIAVPPIPGGSSVVACLEDLVDSYESGRPSRANIEVSHRVAETMLAVAESHRQGGAWIELPVQNRDLYVFHV
jgi:predicted dehydrogenase